MWKIENQHLLEAIAVIFDKNTSEWFPVLLSIDRIFIDKQKKYFFLGTQVWRSCLRSTKKKTLVCKPMCADISFTYIESAAKKTKPFF